MTSNELVTNNELVCPVNQQDCRFFHFCAAKEEQIAGITGDDKASRYLSSVAPEVGSAFSSSHCLTETMTSLVEVADNSSDSRQRAMAKIALSYLDQIVGVFESPYQKQ